MVSRRRDGRSGGSRPEGEPRATGTRLALLAGVAVVAGDVDGDGDLDIIGKLWRPDRGNANGGRNHVDRLENLVRSGGKSSRGAVDLLESADSIDSSPLRSEPGLRGALPIGGTAPLRRRGNAA